ncbi:MAG: hypothetical protein H3C62_01270 [Gemmatimonadaceae bacterium]|nr:hypothetical protein [Gemmatimonadaceae bacterium]
MSRATEILGEREPAFIQTAVKESRGLAAQRMRFLLQFYSAQDGLAHWREHLLKEVLERIATVDGCSVDEVRQDFDAVLAGQADPITFLEQAVITVRTDLAHRVLYV